MPSSLTASSSSVRPAVGADATLALHLMRKFSHDVGYIPAKGVREFVARGWAYASDENDDAAGVLLVRPSLSVSPHVAGIIVAAVALDAQRRSHGLALVEKVLEDAHALGRRFVQAWCREDIAAVAFWEAAGFTRIARRFAPTSAGHGHLLFRRPTTACGPELFDVYEAARPRGPGGKFVSEAAGVPPWSYELTVPWRLKRERAACASRTAPARGGPSFLAPAPSMRSMSAAAA